MAAPNAAIMLQRHSMSANNDDVSSAWLIVASEAHLTPCHL